MIILNALFGGCLAQQEASYDNFKIVQSKVLNIFETVQPTNFDNIETEMVENEKEFLISLLKQHSLSFVEGILYIYYVLPGLRQTVGKKRFEDDFKDTRVRFNSLSFLYYNNEFLAAKRTPKKKKIIPEMVKFSSDGTVGGYRYTYV